MSININDGKIFVLLGTSSAGKSSIIKPLKDTDPSWVEMGPDLAGFSHMADMIRDTFPEEYEKISKGLEHTEIAHAIVEVFYKEKEGKKSGLGFIRWKEGNYSKQEILDLINNVAKNPNFIPLDQSMYTKESADLVNRKMIDFICSNSNQGRSIFVDGMGPDMLDDFLIKTKGYPVKLGLAYLPLPDLVDHVTKRNETAKISEDESEVRSYAQITRQYLEHFRCAKDEDPVIGHLSLEKIDDAFTKMHPKDKEEEETLKDLKTKLIEEYNLRGEQKTALTSRFPYHVLVKTKKSPAESAQSILSSLENS